MDCKITLILTDNKTSCKESRIIVRVKGVEPPRLAALDPKSSASTNFATPALKLVKLSLPSLIRTVK